MFYRRFPDSDGSEDYVVHFDALFCSMFYEVIASQVAQEFFCITELRHVPGIAEIGHLNVMAPGKDKFF